LHCRFSDDIIYCINKNTLTLIFSIVVSVFWLYFFARLPIFPTCEELGCLAIPVIIIFVHFIVIPIIFSVLGFTFSKEHRFKQAFYSFGISFIVAATVFLPQYIIAKNENKLKAEQDFQEMKARYEANPEQYKQRPY